MKVESMDAVYYTMQIQWTAIHPSCIENEVNRRVNLNKEADELGRQLLENMRK